MIHIRGSVHRPRPLPYSLRVGDKTVLVTGSNAGLGLETAKALAACGASLVVLGARSVSRGEEAKRGHHRGGSGGDPGRVRRPRLASSTTTTGPVSWRSSPAPPASSTAASASLSSTPGSSASRAAPPGPPATGPTSQTNRPGTALLSLLPLEPLRRAARQQGGGGDGPACLTTVASFGLPAAAEALLSSSDGHENLLARLDDPASSGMEGTPQARSALEAAQHAPGYYRSLFHRADPDVERLSRRFAWAGGQGAWCIADAAVGHVDVVG
ncbi:hypothetical protein DL771_004993 [Monosporascus sp. 5C6A]|nr:hypothetical protein DL771_004993 [Monosporascus sp. 5C6A]